MTGGVVVDSSAIVAIILDEPRRPALRDALEAAGPRLLSSASLVELGLVLEGRLGVASAGIAERFVRDTGIEIVPVSRDQADRALGGWRRFGRGRHPAALNLGDCFVYGLAAETGLPVLCTGLDLARTDLDVVPLDPGR